MTRFKRYGWLKMNATMASDATAAAIAQCFDSRPATKNTTVAMTPRTTAVPRSATATQRMMTPPASAAGSSV